MSSLPVRYEAAWVPGLASDLEPDTAIRIGEAWLESRQGVPSRTVAMNAKKMVDNRPELRRLGGRFPLVSPRSRDAGNSPRAVLAIFPNHSTLDLAEELALDGALCVIPPALPAFNEEIRRELDGICRFGEGHNEFVGGGEKERAIRGLREVASFPDPPSPVELQNYVLSTGHTGTDGAGRLREWYKGVLRGKRFKDHRRKDI